MLGPKATRVRFRKPIFEDDWVERGMVAWFVGYEWLPDQKAYDLFFDFEDFEKINKKYFREAYYPNKFIEQRVACGYIKLKQRYTAIESGDYNPKYSVYLDIVGLEKPDNSRLLYALNEYLDKEDGDNDNDY